MKIYLLDREKSKTEALKKYFVQTEDLQIITAEFCDFMKKYRVEAIVSPANAFGLMDGEYDLAITEYFGESLQRKVQAYILENYHGMQPVGTSFLCGIDDTGQKLIHTPTMCYPRAIKDPFVIFQCMRTTLMVALENHLKSIVIPVFGGATGKISPEICAAMMALGYQQIMTHQNEISWDHAWDFADQFEEYLCL